MTNLLDLTLDELRQEMIKLGEQPFRAKQIAKWLVMGVPFDEMTDISISLREKLSVSCREGYPVTLQVREAEDGTKKYLFELEDKRTVESVFMPKNYGNTVCISTQVGCAMGCVFCASCADGLVRNLTAGEILAQVIAVNQDNGGGRSVNNIVLMGMGEPLDNYDNTVKFLELVNAKEGLNIGKRSVSLSTCGITDKIVQLAKTGITLSISLHAPTQEQRETIMPSARKYQIDEIIDATKTYFLETGRRVIIEYALIEGFNDAKEDAQALTELLRGLNCHVNLIPLNTWGALKAPPKRMVYAFCTMLEELGISTTVRRSMGSEIEGACGQLRQRYDADQSVENPKTVI